MLSEVGTCLLNCQKYTPDEAIWLENDNVDYIIEVVNSYSSKDIGWIIEKARKNQNIYYKNYTFNCFKDSFVEACKEIKI